MSKLIIALDFENLTKAMALVDKLDPSQCALKVGSEMFTRAGPEFVKSLVNKQFKVFLDLKFHDIPNTVAQACKAASSLGVWMLNVHASGGLAMMQAAKEAILSSDARPLLIAVTVLTSLDEANQATLAHRVEELAQLTYKAELDGIVCSAQEVAEIKAKYGPSFITVTPGIRLAQANEDDQKRIATPEFAVRAGSDYLVVGRPITKAKYPLQVVGQILDTLG